MSDALDAPVDSPEGIKLFMEWAVQCGFVLNEWHEAIAQRHNVELPDGLVIARPITLGTRQ